MMHRVLPWISLGVTAYVLWRSHKAGEKLSRMQSDIQAMRARLGA